MNEFFNGSNTINEADFYKTPYDRKKYEISEVNFKLEENRILGVGEFGQVCCGTIFVEDGETSVAAKTLNPLKLHQRSLQGILFEIKVLAYLGKHENIIELLGAHTSRLKMGQVYIFLELCQKGSLEKQLKAIRSSTCLANVHPICKNSEAEACNISSYKNKLDDTTLENFHKWSTEICGGMVYLSEKHVVHADLATRNVLLNLENVAKICDFGLSRRMYTYTNYVKTGQEPLPWKWMAPESLRDMEFSEKSDVWAYGITLWEIYSLGSSPYPGLPWELNFPEKLESGFRLQEPEYNQNAMYELMKLCWNIQPTDRPNFSQIYSSLTSDANEVYSYATVL